MSFYAGNLVALVDCFPYPQSQACYFRFASVEADEAYEAVKAANCWVFAHPHPFQLNSPRQQRRPLILNPGESVLVVDGKSQLATP